MTFLFVSMDTRSQGCKRVRDGPGSWIDVTYVVDGNSLTGVQGVLQEDRAVPEDL